MRPECTRLSGRFYLQFLNTVIYFLIPLFFCGSVDVLWAKKKMKKKKNLFSFVTFSSVNMSINKCSDSACVGTCCFIEQQLFWIF